MSLWHLKPGHKIRLSDGPDAEVLSETEDGEWIRVRYLGTADTSVFEGSEDLVHSDEVEALLGVIHRSTWSEDLTVFVHYVPESEDSEGSYEAVTMKGVPHEVIITGSDPESAEEALKQLVSGLKAFGFVGRVAVENAVGLGQPVRHRVDVSDD